MIFFLSAIRCGIWSFASFSGWSSYFSIYKNYSQVLQTHSSAHCVFLSYLLHLIRIISLLEKLNWLCHIREIYKMCNVYNFPTFDQNCLTVTKQHLMVVGRETTYFRSSPTAWAVWVCYCESENCRCSLRKTHVRLPACRLGLIRGIF